MEIGEFIKVRGVENRDFNELRREQLAKAMQPIEEFMNTHCSPHDVLIISQGRASLFSGELSIKLEVLD